MKRPFDFSLSLLGLIASAPLWVLIPFAIWFDDGCPIFYSHERVGWNGKRFRVLKFRSMIRGAEAAHGPIAAAVEDPRITRVGRLLRQTAMDELPQLINILRGDMSFVGPRADRPWELDVSPQGPSGNPIGGRDAFGPDAEAVGDAPDFVQLIPNYGQRLAVRPGLTGLAQIYASSEAPRRSKLRFDRLYIRNVSFWLDARLIAISFWITLRRNWENRGKKF